MCSLVLVAGYISTCLYKRTVLQWKSNVLMIAFLYLGIFYLTLIWPCGYSTQLQLFCSQHCWPGYFHFDTSMWILDFSVIPIRIFRNQIPLDFINHIKNTPATFQRMINTVISGLQGCNAYINDVIMYSDT